MGVGIAFAQLAEVFNVDALASLIVKATGQIGEVIVQQGDAGIGGGDNLEDLGGKLHGEVFVRRNIGGERPCRAGLPFEDVLTLLLGEP